MAGWFESISDDAYQIYAEVRHPYTASNRSYHLFSVGLTFLMGQSICRPLRIVNEIIKRVQVGNPPLQSPEIFEFV